MLTAEQIKAGQLYPAVADLHGVRPGPGLLRFGAGFAILAALVWATFSVESGTAFVALALVSGFAYASLLITTHDALHHTLTGWAWFDEIVPRLISYPALWPHGLYSELHKIHHKMNGVDLRDPERVQWTEREYEEAGPLGKFLARRQWFFDLFVWGGFGMIYGHVKDGLALSKEFPRIRLALLTDLVGLLAVNGAIYYVAARHGAALKYLCFYLLQERTVGLVQQLRSHIEHYGLWDKAESALATQVFNCRNLETSAFGSLFFNRLNYHSAHHAFPRIPFYRLAEAHQRLQAIYGPGRPLPSSVSYLRTSWKLATRPRFI
jgi:fatty acid desaturase